MKKTKKRFIDQDVSIPNLILMKLKQICKEEYIDTAGLQLCNCTIPAHGDRTITVIYINKDKSRFNIRDCIAITIHRKMEGDQSQLEGSFNVIVLSTGEIINISEEWVPTVLVGKIAASM